MFDPRHARYYAHVIPLFWPWLWLQLLRLECWQKLHKCDVLLAVDRMGSIYIRAVADAPSSRYRYDAPAVPVWERVSLSTDLSPEFLEIVPPVQAASGEAVHGAARVFRSDAPLYLLFDTS